MTDVGCLGQGLVGDSLGLALHNLVNRHLQDMAVCGKGKLYSGYLDSEEDYILFVDDLKALGVSFSTENSKIYKHSRILFTSEMRNSEFKIPYFGSPFQIIKSSYLLCSQGGNYRPQVIAPLSSDNPPKKRRFSLQPTKKIGCKALMMVKCIRVFDEDCYKAKSPIYKDCSYENRTIMAKLNKDLLSPTPPTGTLRFMVVMSTADEHNHTVVSTNLNQILHPRLREEIYKCAELNTICSVKAMRTHLNEVVRCMFEGEDRPQPDSLNRCYYPSDTSLRFHMRQAGFTIVRSKRRTKYTEKGIVQSVAHTESDPSLDASVLMNADNPSERLQIQPSVFTIRGMKRDKTALEQCIILRRGTNTEEQPNFDIDIDQNGDEEDSNQLKIEPGEQCIILRRGTNTEEQPNFDIDIDQNEDEEDSNQLKIEPGVFTIENTDPNLTATEQCIILRRDTDNEDHSNSDIDDCQGEEMLEFYTEEEVITNSPEDVEEEEVEVLDHHIHTQDDVIDLKKLCDETRENLKMMVRYTYLLHSPESALEIAHLTQQLKDKMMSSVFRANEGILLVPTELNVQPQLKKRNKVDSIKKQYSKLPQRCKPRNSGKYVD